MLNEGEMNVSMILIRTFLPIILCGTIILTILMLPVYFIRKKKNPDVKRNTIIRLIVLSFAAVSIFVLLLGSGLIIMYFQDLFSQCDECLGRRMYNMIQKSDRDNHDYFVTLENSMNNMIPIGSRIFESFMGQK